MRIERSEKEMHEHGFTPVGGAPLSIEELRKIDAYWRASNYLSVGQIYLLRNPLLKEPLSAGDIRAEIARPLGNDAGPEFRLRSPEPAY